LSATFHDPSIAIVSPEGEILFAEAIERPLQDKRALNCPPDGVLRVADLVEEYCDPDAELIAAVSFSERHSRVQDIVSLIEFGLRSTLGSRVTSYLERSLLPDSWPYPRMHAVRTFMRNSISSAGLGLTGNRSIVNPVQIRRYEHHYTHAAYGCYSSAFSDAACAVVDGWGETGSLDFFSYRAGVLERLQTPISGSSSLGYFYAIVTALCGFDPMQGEEWKVMGLAPYGQVDDELYALLKRYCKVDGLRLRPSTSVRERKQLRQALLLRQRPPGSDPIAAANMARTGQQVFSEVMRELLHNLHRQHISHNLVLTGGCALNSSFNGRILDETPFERLHVPSAPGDDGNSVGAALLAYFEDHPQRRRPRKLLSPYLGTDISQETRAHLLRFNQSSRLTQLSHHGVIERTAKLLADGKIIGWMQGRAEFGPRSLGHRSILADPRSPNMKDHINGRVKFREEYRPFAPSILHEFGPDYFENYQLTPYMERTLVFRDEVRSKVPAVVHEDGTGRLQSVLPELAPRFYQLIRAFYDITGVPILLNTSFNIMGKPIIHSIQDALGMFHTTGLDALVIDDIVIEKDDVAVEKLDAFPFTARKLVAASKEN
jgi:carbamoyltransferase